MGTLPFMKEFGLQGPCLLWLLGPNSIVVRCLDPLGSLLSAPSDTAVHLVWTLAADFALTFGVWYHCSIATRVFKGFLIRPCDGPLLASGGVSSMGPHFVHNMKRFGALGMPHKLPFSKALPMLCGYSQLGPPLT